MNRDHSVIFHFSHILLTPAPTTLVLTCLNKWGMFPPQSLHLLFPLSGIFFLLKYFHSILLLATQSRLRVTYFPWTCFRGGTSSFNTSSVPVTEKAMTTHSSTLAWKIPWVEEPGGLQSVRSIRVGHDWATSLSLFTFMHWRRKWQPTPVFLAAESQGRGSLVGCRLWGRRESDTTEAT